MLTSETKLGAQVTEISLIDEIRRLWMVAKPPTVCFGSQLIIDRNQAAKPKSGCDSIFNRLQYFYLHSKCKSNGVNLKKVAAESGLASSAF